MSFATRPSLKGLLRRIVRDAPRSRAPLLGGEKAIEIALGERLLNTQIESKTLSHATLAKGNWLTQLVDHAANLSDDTYWLEALRVIAHSVDVSPEREVSAETRAAAALFLVSLARHREWLQLHEKEVRELLTSVLNVSHDALQARQWARALASTAPSQEPLDLPRQQEEGTTKYRRVCTLGTHWLSRGWSLPPRNVSRDYTAVTALSMGLTYAHHYSGGRAISLLDRLLKLRRQAQPRVRTPIELAARNTSRLLRCRKRPFVRGLRSVMPPDFATDDFTRKQLESYLHRQQQEHEESDEAIKRREEYEAQQRLRMKERQLIERKRRQAAEMQARQTLDRMLHLSKRREEQ
ncbi:MAG: hypothetical protein MHM6MM_006599 [Cercozoa sp. M6MM]